MCEYVKAIGYKNPVEYSSAGFFVASFGGESGFEIERGHSNKTRAICLNMYCYLDFQLMERMNSPITCYSPRYKSGTAMAYYIFRGYTVCRANSLPK